MDNSGYLLGQKGGKVLNTVAADDCLTTALQCRLVSPKKLFLRKDRAQKHGDQPGFYCFVLSTCKIPAPTSLLIYVLIGDNLSMNCLGSYAFTCLNK